MGYIIKNDKIFYTAKGFNYEYELLEADLQSFTILGEHHAKDMHNVYYQNRTIKSATTEEFVSLGEEFGKDKNFVFWQTILIKNADPNSFESLGNGFAQDINHYYECANIIEKPPTKIGIEKVVSPKRDREVLLKEKLKNGDLTVLDELINDNGQTYNHLGVFIWSYVAIELDYKCAELEDLIKILTEEDLTKKQIKKGYKKVAEIFTHGEWVQKNLKIAKKYNEKTT